MTSYFSKEYCLSGVAYPNAQSPELIIAQQFRWLLTSLKSPDEYEQVWNQMGLKGAHSVDFKTDNMTLCIEAPKFLISVSIYSNAFFYLSHKFYRSPQRNTQIPACFSFYNLLSVLFHF